MIVHLVGLPLTVPLTEFAVRYLRERTGTPGLIIMAHFRRRRLQSAIHINAFNRVGPTLQKKRAPGLGW